MDEVLETCKQDNIKFIELQFTDLFGNPKSAPITIKHLAGSLDNGTWFDGSSIRGFARIQESDMILKPDISTYRVLPWDKSTARFICDVHTPAGKPFESDPRSILRRMTEKAASRGYTYNVGPELEFYLVKMNGGLTLLDNAGYYDMSYKDFLESTRKEMVSALVDLGIDVEMHHHECGPSQHEIDFQYSDAITTADNALTLKLAIKTIAARKGIVATFMPKPLKGEAGSGMHVHQSLFRDGANLFHNDAGRYCLSDIAEAFIAGQLSHANELSAILSPTVNSYKRLVPGYEAPVYVCWGQMNRSALVRVPQHTAGLDNATRAELRCPDPSCNPYLAFAVMLAAGLDGIDRGMKLGDPVGDDVYKLAEDKRLQRGILTLPGSLGEAIEHLKASRMVRDVLGEQAFNDYIHAKSQEWDEYRLEISEWERQKYIDA